MGLALALALARARRRVLVLEREASTAEHSRAPAIWPGTQEILADLGLIDRFIEDGICLSPVQLVRVGSTRPLITLPLGELRGETSYPQLLILPQSRTERLLLEALRGCPSAEVRFCARVTTVEADADAVRTTFVEASSATNSGTDSVSGTDSKTVSSRFLIGCDGAHSTVRQVVGASFDGETYGTRAALADIELDRDRDLPFPRLGSEGAVAIGIRISDRLWRLILPYAANDERPLDDRVEAAAVHLFPDVSSGDSYRTVWQSEFRLHRRIASTFATGRIALAGDAAHLNSPVGGQGMNAGLRDAALLAEVLLEALDLPTGDIELLERYGKKRRMGISAGVNRFTDRLTRLLLFRNGTLIGPMFGLAKLLLMVPPFRRRFLRRVAMLE